MAPGRGAQPEEQARLACRHENFCPALRPLGRPWDAASWAGTGRAWDNPGGCRALVTFLCCLNFATCVPPACLAPKRLSRRNELSV